LFCIGFIAGVGIQPALDPTAMVAIVIYKLTVQQLPIDIQQLAIVDRIKTRIPSVENCIQMTTIRNIYSLIGLISVINNADLVSLPVVSCIYVDGIGD
jgi:hypothetical protein